jgi:hypothetical protein
MALATGPGTSRHALGGRGLGGDRPRHHARAGGCARLGTLPHTRPPARPRRWGGVAQMARAYTARAYTRSASPSFLCALAR